MISVALLCGCSHAPIPVSDEAPAFSPSPAGSQRLAAELGVEIISLRTTAGGHMLDLRYRVTDPDKARAVLRENSQIDIQILDMTTGTALMVGESDLGKLRTKSTKPKRTKVYYSLFDNPGAAVKTGAEVAVKFGSVRVDGIRVE
ncbi:MAG: hypothetical protein AB1451_15875 [Nitrospirota bacterium]